MSKASKYSNNSDYNNLHFNQISENINTIGSTITSKISEYYERQMQIDTKFNEDLNTIMSQLLEELNIDNISLKELYEKRVKMEEISDKNKQFAYMIFNYLKENKNIWNN